MPTKSPLIRSFLFFLTGFMPFAFGAEPLAAQTGRIEGQVRNDENLAPVDTTVKLFNAAGVYLTRTGTNGGNYVFDGLAPGDYYLTALPSGVWAGVLYPNVPCQGNRYEHLIECPRELGTRVTVGAGQTVSGIDLELPRGTTISGRVFAAATGLPLAGVAVSAFFDHSSEELWIATTGADGRFTAVGLADTRMKIFAAPSGYSPQYYRQINCVSFFDPSCRELVPWLEVRFGQQITGIDFPLVEPGTLSGRVTDAATGQPVHAQVVVRRAANQAALTRIATDAAGNFQTGELPPIEVVVFAESEGAVIGAFGGNPPRVVMVRPGQNTAGIDIAIVRQAPVAIVGRVVQAAGGGPVLGCTVYLVRDGESEAFAARGCTEDGEFEIREIPPGRYRLVAKKEGSEEYAHYLHGFGSCNWTRLGQLCHNLEDGAVIDLQAGETVGPLVLPLERSAELRVAVAFAASGQQPARSARIRVFDEEGFEIRTEGLSEPSSARSIFLAPGRYRVTVEGDPHWQSFAWGGVPCGRWFCDPRDGAPIDLDAGETASESFTLEPIAPYGDCVADATTLCLNQGRFEVRAIWGDYLGVSGAGIAHPIAADTGYFYFFTPNNVEVLVKALDGCDGRLGHHFWFFAGGLTDVQVELRVKDTLTGAFQLYTNRLGTTFDPILDTAAFATCDAEEPAPASGAAAAAAIAAASLLAPAPQPATYCELVPYPRTCVTGGRFAVKTVYGWRGGYRAEGQPLALTGDSVAFWFYDPNNYEVMVKVLDACHHPNPGYWVFAAGLTDVEVDVEVEDLATGRKKTYLRGPGPFAPILDLGSFPCD